MAEVSRVRVNLVVPLLALAAVALLALLAFDLRHVDPGAEELPPIPIPDQSPDAAAVQEGAGDALRVLFVGTIATIALIAVAGSLLLWRRGIRLGKLLSIWEVLGFALTIVFLILALLFFNNVRQGLDAFARWVTGDRNPGGTGGEGSNVPVPPGSDPASIVLIVVIVLLGVYLVAFAVLFLPRLYSVATAGAPDVGRPKRELARAVRQAIADLEAGEDLRAAVLRCYRSMVLLFAQHGLRPEPSQTAREFQAAALGSIGVPREGVDDLTSLFEEARYSEHPIGERQRDAALASLRTIRTGLEAPA